MKRRYFVHRAAVLVGGLGLSLATSASAANWKEGASLPDLSGFGLEGALPKMKGKVVYLDFWASWCAPCKASFPVLNGWHQQYASKGFMVLGVNVDETSEAMQTFLKKNTVAFPIVRDAGHKLVASANVTTMPSSFIIDRKGVIRQVHTGFRGKDAESLSALISKLVSES